jgi:hypothetical protein
MSMTTPWPWVLTWEWQLFGGYDLNRIFRALKTLDNLLDGCVTPSTRTTSVVKSIPYALEIDIGSISTGIRDEGRIVEGDKVRALD